MELIAKNFPKMEETAANGGNGTKRYKTVENRRKRRKTVHPQIRLICPGTEAAAFCLLRPRPAVSFAEPGQAWREHRRTGRDEGLGSG
jgi:hypothetical protein